MISRKQERVSRKRPIAFNSHFWLYFIYFFLVLTKNSISDNHLSMRWFLRGACLLCLLSLLFFEIAHIRHDSPSQIILAHIQAWVTPVITTIHPSRECPLTLCPSTQKVVVTHSTTRFLLSDLFLWRFLQKIANAYKLLWWIRTIIPGCILWRHDSRFLFEC